MPENEGFDNSQFFDDEGNLIGTSWGLRAEMEEEKERKEQELREKKKKRRELNRRVAIDNSQAEFMDQHEKTMQKRKIKEKWMSMPMWIRKMPRVPLSAPPTQGRKEILLTKMTGNVHLTEEEKKKRIRDLKRLKLAIADYESIHRLFDNGLRMLPTAIISFGEEVGGTMVTRSMSSAIAESRGDYGKVVSFDFSVAGNKFSEWFGISNDQHAYMKSVYKWIMSQSNSFGVDFIPTSNGTEYHLANRHEKNRRIPPTDDVVVSLYKSVIGEQGVLLMDCDYREEEAALVAAILSATPIFVVPLHKNAISRIQDFFTTLEQRGVSQEKIRSMKNNCIVIASSIVPEMSDKKGREVVKSFLGKLTEECGIDGGNNNERVIHIAYDKGLNYKNFNWRKLSFATQHSIRSVCGMVIGDVAVEESVNTGEE